jgi:hypothetical protein
LGQRLRAEVDGELSRAEGIERRLRMDEENNTLETPAKKSDNGTLQDVK